MLCKNVLRIARVLNESSSEYSCLIKLKISTNTSLDLEVQYNKYSSFSRSNYIVFEESKCFDFFDKIID